MTPSTHRPERPAEAGRPKNEPVITDTRQSRPKPVEILGCALEQDRAVPEFGGRRMIVARSECACVPRGRR